MSRISCFASERQSMSAGRNKNSRSKVRKIQRANARARKIGKKQAYKLARMAAKSRAWAVRVAGYMRSK